MLTSVFSSSSCTWAEIVLCTPQFKRHNLVEFDAMEKVKKKKKVSKPDLKEDFFCAVLPPDLPNALTTNFTHMHTCTEP